MEGCGVWRKEQNFNLDLGLSLKKTKVYQGPQLWRLGV